MSRRRPYKSPFESLFSFEKGKEAIKQLASFHDQLKQDLEMQKNTGKIMAFVEANPYKAAIGVGLAASTWLLYQGICLGSEIERFFDEIEELKGLFKEYSKGMPRLVELYLRVGNVTDYKQLEKQIVYLEEVCEELTKYYDDLEKIMATADDVIADVKKGKEHADRITDIFGTIATIAAVAATVGVPATLALAPLILSTTSTTPSILKIADDRRLKKASTRLKSLKHDLSRLKDDLRQLREQLMKKIVEMTKEMERLFREESIKKIFVGILVGLVICLCIVMLLNWRM